MILAAAALSVLGSAQTFPPEPLVPDHDLEAHGIRYSGPPRISEGRYAFNTVILQQPMAYAQTAQLQTTVVVRDGLSVRKLDKGTRLFFTQYNHWCTYPMERSTEVCLKSDGGRWSWNQDYEGIDLTYPFRFVYALCCTWQVVPQLQTIIAIKPPAMKEVVDNRTVMTAILALNTSAPGENAEGISRYCTPVRNLYSQRSCGTNASLEALQHRDIIYTAGGGTAVRIHFDAAENAYMVSHNSSDSKRDAR